MEDRRKLLNDFLDAFPLETLKDMPLEKYTNLNRSDSFLTSSSCHPKVFVKEFCYFLMSCHQHCLGVNLLVQR